MKAYLCIRLPSSCDTTEAYTPISTFTANPKNQLGYNTRTNIPLVLYQVIQCDLQRVSVYKVQLCIQHNIIQYVTCLQSGIQFCTNVLFLRKCRSFGRSRRRTRSRVSSNNTTLYSSQERERIYCWKIKNNNVGLLLLYF